MKRRSTSKRKLQRAKTQMLLGHKSQVMLCAKGLVDAEIVRAEDFGALKDKLQDVGWSEESTQFISKDDNQTFDGLKNKFISPAILNASEESNSEIPTLENFVKDFKENFDVDFEDAEELKVEFQKKTKQILDSPQGDGFLMYAMAYLGKEKFCDLLSITMNSKSLVKLDTQFSEVKRFENIRREEALYEKLFETIKNKPAEFLEVMKADMKNKNFDADALQTSSNKGFLRKAGLSPKEWVKSATTSIGMKGTAKTIFSNLFAEYVSKERKSAFKEKKGFAALGEIRADRRFNPFTYLRVAVDGGFALAFSGIDRLSGQSMGGKRITSKPGAIVAKGLLNLIRIPTSMVLRVLGDPVGVVESVGRSIKMTARKIRDKSSKKREERGKKQLEERDNTALKRLDNLNEAFKQLGGIQEHHSDSTLNQVNNFLRENVKFLVQAKMINTTELDSELKGFSEEEKSLFHNKLALASAQKENIEVAFNQKELSVLFKHMQSNMGRVKTDVINNTGGIHRLLEKFENEMSAKGIKKAIKAVSASKVPLLDFSKIKERLFGGGGLSPDSVDDTMSSTGRSRSSSHSVILDNLGEKSPEFLQSDDLDTSYATAEDISEDQESESTEIYIIGAKESLEDDKITPEEDNAEEGESYEI